MGMAGSPSQAVQEEQIPAHEGLCEVWPLSHLTPFWACTQLFPPQRMGDKACCSWLVFLL